MICFTALVIFLTPLSGPEPTPWSAVHSGPYRPHPDPEILLCIVVRHIIKGVFQASASQLCHFPMQVLLKIIEKVVKLIQSPVDIGEFKLTLQAVIIQKSGGRFPLGGRIEDPVYNKIAENLIQGIFSAEPGTFLAVCNKSNQSPGDGTRTQGIYSHSSGDGCYRNTSFPRGISQSGGHVFS